MVSQQRAIAGRKGKFRLRNVLVVPFVLQILAAVGCVGYLSYRNGEQGVLTCQMGLDQIRNFLQTLKVGNSGQVFIMEPQGELIASSIKDQPLSVRGRSRSKNCYRLSYTSMALKSCR